jgi:hypothetical protein
MEQWLSSEKKGYFQFNLFIKNIKGFIVYLVSLNNRWKKDKKN